MAGCASTSRLTLGKASPYAAPIFETILTGFLHANRAQNARFVPDDGRGHACPLAR